MKLDSLLVKNIFFGNLISIQPIIYSSIFNQIAFLSIIILILPLSAKISFEKYYFSKNLSKFVE
jgi:hypothetical protein